MTRFAFPRCCIRKCWQEAFPTVKVRVEAGADPSAMTNHGMTPLQLAKSLG